MAKNNHAKERLAEFYRATASLFVGFPADLKVTFKEIQNSKVVLYTSCHADDKGKLIGGHGATFDAMLTLCKMYGAQVGLNVILDRIQATTGEKGEITPKHMDEHWVKHNRSKIVVDILNGICGSIFRLPTMINYLDQPDDRTTFQIKVDSKENTALPLGKVENDLGIIFAAIGNVLGRVVRIEIKRNA